MLHRLPLLQDGIDLSPFNQKESTPLRFQRKLIAPRQEESREQINKRTYFDLDFSTLP